MKGCIFPKNLAMIVGITATSCNVSRLAVCLCLFRSLRGTNGEFSKPATTTASLKI